MNFKEGTTSFVEQRIHIPSNTGPTEGLPSSAGDQVDQSVENTSARTLRVPPPKCHWNVGKCQLMEQGGADSAEIRSTRNTESTQNSKSTEDMKSTASIDNNGGLEDVVIGSIGNIRVIKSLESIASIGIDTEGIEHQIQSFLSLRVNEGIVGTGDEILTPNQCQVR